MKNKPPILIPIFPGYVLLLDSPVPVADLIRKGGSATGV